MQCFHLAPLLFIKTESTEQNSGRFRHLLDSRSVFPHLDLALKGTGDGTFTLSLIYVTPPKHNHDTKIIRSLTDKWIGLALNALALSALDHAP